MARSVADVALMWSVLTGRPAPQPRLAGLTIGLLRQPPGIGDGRATERSDLAEGWVAELERLGARVVEARIPEPSANTWPQFQHEAAQSHAATFPSRADEYGDVMRTKLEAAQRVRADDVEAAYARDRGVAAVRAGRRPLRQPVLRRRAAAGGCGRARGPAPADLVPALGEPDRVGGARDRESAADRTDATR